MTGLLYGPRDSRWVATEAGEGVVTDSDMVFNGINAATGRPAIPAMPTRIISDVALGISPDPIEDAARMKHRASARPTLGVAYGVDPEDLAQAGWGVIFARDADPGIRSALDPLVQHRRSQASATTERRFRVLEQSSGYQPKESAEQFLDRFGLMMGSPVVPDQLPYYLLIVGGPDEIPFSFQYALDVGCAVGRIAFDDVGAYARYAAAVVAAEQSPPRARNAALFAPRHSDRDATALSADHLVAPLAEVLPTTAPAGWTFTSDIGPGATKARLAQLLGGGGPSLVFSASHGLEWPSGHPDQRRDQGALLCQDSPGPQAADAPVTPEVYLAGRDVADAPGPGPMIAMLFACFGAGTPRENEFPGIPDTPPELAPAPFVADLPQTMLGHSRAPALAVVGHVERAWAWSFLWPTAGDQLEVFRSPLRAIIDGKRLGSALETMGQRYGALSSSLLDLRRRAAYDVAVDDRTVARLWTAQADARNYVILGDPAVRLEAAKEP